jgi:NTP pyrophosphatase (non-canonical NTP hydrolase)
MYERTTKSVGCYYFPKYNISVYFDKKPNILHRLIRKIILNWKWIDLVHTSETIAVIPVIQQETKVKTTYTTNLVQSKSFLDELFERQIKIQKILGFDFTKMTLEEKEQYTKDTCLYLLEEVHELLREINFKKHKKVRHPVNRDNIKDELSDILHFFVNAAICWEVNTAELSTACIAKNDKNLQRISNPEY